MRFWAAIFGLGAGFNILIGLHGWPGVWHGQLNDPDSYMRLERILQGVRAGHLTNIVARDDSGAGVLVEWSRLLDAFIWAAALPFVPFIGWRHALFAAGVVSGPVIAGVLAVALAYAAEPFAARRFLWLVPVCLGLPGLRNYAGPGFVTHHILLLAMIGFSAGLVMRAWDGDIGRYFAAGLSGGLAIWLTPETMPFIMLCFGLLLSRWVEKPTGAGMAALGAGCFDVLCFGLAIDPPVGGYGVAEIDRLSIVYVGLGLALLCGGVLLWRLQAMRQVALRRAAGLAGVGLLLACWLTIFPNILLGPYGLMTPAAANIFFPAIIEMKPLWPTPQSFALIWPGLAALFVLFPICCAKNRWPWWYGFGCMVFAVVLGVKFMRFTPVCAAAAVVVLMIGLQNVASHWRAWPKFAVFGQAGLALMFLLLPWVPALAAGQGVARGVPVCNLQSFAPDLRVAAGQVVLADVNLTPELLWRSNVLTVGSLYHHGVAGFLVDRAAWRAVPGEAEPAAVKATNARYVLFCTKAGRSGLVADLPKTTLWDALLAQQPPPWLVPVVKNAASGWRLYKITQ